MDTTSTPHPSFVPTSCTLPTAEQPLRVAEFESLFATALRSVTRRSPTELLLVLDGSPETQAGARDLATRESGCCSFFTFTFTGTELTVTVPSAHQDVLDGLQRLAETA
ncbi:hypothetical protein CLV30_11953 [Haloactinopolyspora alba]|uniref:Arsenate reductase n=1 Tax=Haloactinopolyspora alba TaxID=648780 RepID=A0A2P8DN94_9ACTN|nr:hypothetical protein [Haloactinopolyspora alba]PSK98670.1 hypothetical protein CLV30_11953 [Haloactinopolyspora alba]